MNFNQQWQFWFARSLLFAHFAVPLLLLLPPLCLPCPALLPPFVFGDDDVFFLLSSTTKMENFLLRYFCYNSLIMVQSHHSRRAEHRKFIHLPLARASLIGQRIDPLLLYFATTHMHEKI